MHSVCVYFYYDELPRLIHVARCETNWIDPDKRKRDSKFMS